MKIAVGGMIASGKTSLTKLLSTKYKLPVIEEFTQHDEVFHTLLKWLYEGKPNVEMLLQIYFIHNQWLKHKELGDNYVVDRDVIEHWIFAQVNLRKHPQVLNMYNGLFHAYMNDIKLPDLYIILDMDWDNFKQRVYKRGRDEEIANFKKNEDYFKGLLETYTSTLAAQCTIYNIPYVIIDSNNRDIYEVAEEALKFIEPIKKKLQHADWGIYVE